MIQYGLDIALSARGFFTLEKDLINLSLSEIEDKLGYHKGRLKQGADFYILSPPTQVKDFEIMATSVFPGHRFEGSNLQRSINSEGKKKEHLSLFRRKRLIKVVPLQLHLEALRPFLKDEEYFLIRDIETTGVSTRQLVNEIKRRFRNNANLVAQIERNLAIRAEVYQRVRETGVDDYLYPSAKGGGVLQWRLNVAVPARCACRMTDYTKDRYQRVL